MPKNNIPVEDVTEEEVVVETPTKGNLPTASEPTPGATVKVGAGKGSNLSIPGAASMDEAQTMAILERLQKFVDEKDSNKGVINPLMKGLNLAYATTYGPDALTRTQAMYDTQDKDVQNTLNTMGGLASTMASNKAFMTAANGPQSSGQAQDGTMPVQGAPGAQGAQQAPQMPSTSPIDKIIDSLPGSLKEKALIYKKMGNRAGYEEIMKMAGEYETKGRTSESKNYAEIMAMPEGKLKEMRMRQFMDKAYEPITTYRDGVEFKESGPGAGGVANAPSAATGQTDFVRSARDAGVPVISGTRSPLEQAELRHHKDPQTGQWMTKEDRPVSEASKHLTGKAIDIDPSKPLGPTERAWLEANAYRPDPKRDPNHYEMKATPAATTSRGAVPGLPAGSPAAAKYGSEQFADQNKMDREAIVKPLRERQVKDENLPSEIDKTLAIVEKGKFGPGTGLRQFILESKGLFSNLSKPELKELTNTRTLESTSRKLILADAKGSLPGSFSDSDRTYIDKTGASINDPKEFIKATLQLKKASVLANRDLANYLSKPENSGNIAQAYQAYQESGRGMQILREHAPTLFKYAKGEPGGSATAAAPATVHTDDAARAWLAKNPNDPKAAAVRKSLEGK